MLPRRGARVASLSSTEAAQVIEIRQALEPVAIRFLLEQNDPDRLKPLEEILDRLRKAGQEDDWANLVAIDMEFHEAVYQLAGSPMLLRLWDTLRVPLLQDLPDAPAVLTRSAPTCTRPTAACSTRSCPATPSPRRPPPANTSSTCAATS